MDPRLASPKDILSAASGLRPPARLAMLIKAVAAHPHSADLWAKLGGNMIGTHEVVLDGASRRMTSRDCYIQALAVDPRCQHAWRMLAVSLNVAGARITVALRDGRLVSVRECLLAALQCDPQHKMVWGDLGRDLGLDEIVTVNGVGYTKIQCLEIAYYQDPSPATLYQVGSVLDVGQYIVLSGHLYRQHHPLGMELLRIPHSIDDCIEHQERVYP